MKRSAWDVFKPVIGVVKGAPADLSTNKKYLNDPKRPAARATGVTWRVYMLRCADGSLYTGCTNDLKRRTAAHNAGKGARYTRSRRPVTVVWSRRVKDKSAALSLEARIKQLTRAQKLALLRRSPRAAKVLSAAS